MADKRIIELEERLTLEENDYLASDNTNGTCKVNAGIITNQFSDMQNKLGAKNLLKNGLTSRTTSGLTITVNSNGSILINGTAAADVSLTLVQNFTLAAGEYILSGVGSDAPGIGLSLNASYGGNTVTCNKDNTQKHFTLSSDSNITNVNMSITAGLAFTNYTLYPMIRPASVADEAFVAYEKTNAQLTKELGDPSTASAVSGSDAFGKIASLNNDLLKQQSGKTALLTMNTDYTSFKITMPRAFADANYRVFLTAEDANGMFDALWVHPTSERTSSTFKVLVYCPHSFAAHNLYINWLAIHD